ncbi:bifunctional acetate--CoA ligase family protein/GNAT family N-acetyltransferase [Calidifontibacter terrae]
MTQRPPGYPAGWEADVVLRDGSVAQVRPIRPADVEALQEFHRLQSPESIYLRFFAPMKALSDKDAYRFANVDYIQRVALVMEASGQMIGVARYDRLSGPTDTSAEVAFNVSDHFQGRGVGSVLLEHLASIGREAGVLEFVADVLPQNRKMMGVFVDAGFEVKHHFDDGVIALTFPIAQTEASEAVRVAREQRAESVSVRALLHPRSVAVIGVSRRRDSTGRDIVDHLVAGGFTGDLYAVNATAHADIAGLTIHRSLAEIEAELDLAIIAVPAAEVPGVVLQCADHGVRAVLVVSAGFAEAGAEGAQLQHALLRTARTHGMRVVGPNSFGIINTAPDISLNAALAPAMPTAGAFGLFSQSGALAIAGLESAGRRGLGVSTFVSAGNRIDVSGNDLMQYWLDDESTQAVGLYLESMGNPRKFNRIARRLSAKKPVIVVKSGVSQYGTPPGHQIRPTRIKPEAFGAMLGQAGVIRVENVHQMFDIAQLVVHQPIPQGDRVAVVGNSDALGALAADACVAWGLQVVHGPVNLPPDADRDAFEAAVRAAFEDPQVDSVVTTLIPPRAGGGVEIARALGSVAAEYDKPCVTTFLGIRGVSDALSSGRSADGRREVVPSYAMPEDAVRALAEATRYGQWRRRQTGAMVLPEGIDHERADAILETVLHDAPQGRTLTQPETEALLAAYGIALMPSYPVSSAREAARHAHLIGYPVVLKSTSPIARIQPVSSVRADLATAAQVRSAYAVLDERLAPIGANTFVVQQMVTPGIPCVVASEEDTLFGPIVRFSLGGVPSEVMNDFGYRIPPFTENDVDDLIDSVRAAPILRGRSGRAPIDREALRDVVARISVLANNHPQVYELELNPVNTHAGGAEVLGARIAVAPPVGRSDSGRRSLTSEV